MSKMYSGRFKEEQSSLLDKFNASLMFDNKLYKEDIKGSITHSKMLAKQGILTDKEAEKIAKGLKQIEKEFDEGRFELNIKDEDIHMAIEKRLTEIIGETGKKLHTARSRNDQVALDFRMYVLRKNIEISSQIKTLMETFITLAKEHTESLIPGMTHLQHAQPTNFGYHLLAYVNMFKRDYERFLSSFKRNNYSPIGSAALAGTPHKIDREFTAKELGFIAPTMNALDSVSDRDFALEILFNISTLMMHISRLAEELIIWSSYEFKFVTISDKYSTGSSIMPQKKNPDVPELLRGKTGRVNGNLISLLTVMKSLSLAYNKDMQEDKEGVFDSVESVEISLEILNEVMKTLKVNVDKMEKACAIGHLSATDFADYLVENCNVAFREAHFITGEAVALCEDSDKDISQAKLEELHKSVDLAKEKNPDSNFDSESVKSNIKDDILEVLDLRNSMNSRDSLGGTSTNQTKKQIEIFENWLKERE